MEPGNDLILRPMQAADLQAAAAVWWRSSTSVDAGADHPSLEAMTQRLAAEPWEVILACRNGTIVGILALQPAARHLRQLFVEPSAKGTGIGSRLLAEGMSRIPQGFLNTDAANAPARAFYEARGLRLAGLAAHPVWGGLQARYEWG